MDLLSVAQEKLIDWNEIKKILNSIIDALKAIDIILPPSLIKNLIETIIRLLIILISWLPNLKVENLK